MNKKILYALFFVIQIAFIRFEELNHNTSSRFAAMSAVCSKGTFEISPFLSWTTDWSQTPDGKVYSNKAPGALFFGLPIYCTTMWIAQTIQKPANDEELALVHWKLRYLVNLLLCLFLQIIPWIIICEVWDKKFVQIRISESARQVGRVALLFGSTPAILANIWMGHSWVGMLSLFGLWLLMEKRWVLLGMTLGFLTLTEYSSVLLFPGVLLAIPNLRPNLFQIAGKIGLGATLPLAVWIAYHGSIFGSIFGIPNQYQNPVFQDKIGERIQLWGILGLPDISVLLQLVLGWYRGILFSQPWVLLTLVSVGALFRKWNENVRISWIYATSGLGLLLLMNSSFGGWHGGASAGPRYLSAALPVFAIPLTLCWESLSEPWKKAILGSLCLSLIVFALAMVFGSSTGLWIEWWSALLQKPLKHGIKFGLLLALVAIARALKRL